ncbi:sensor histidine kinase [Leeuwenhoekiella polynyae]|uniref:histidine kinase n=1 Tax=Leeuwenhoekiella polynyae TaxID=1550906 RepID=A0A4Q0PIF0_9FLAO|nr:HAMP domain-containing sensor histidine kinase [Leeuwenhoekiella polynyae]RXG26061.1 hypothetical protein DSM02_52 [Leeuwenhoekiella polynyae]
MNDIAKLIENNNDTIINMWEEKVIKEIEVSKNTKSLVLRNQLPHLLNDIAVILEGQDDLINIKNEESYKGILTNSEDHGRHRATTLNYTIASILEEYVVFNEVITAFLRERNSYDVNVGLVLHYVIQTAMVQSARSFSDSINDMKEKLISMLAHDIRNPLSAAKVALEMLKTETDINEIHEVSKMTATSLDFSLKLIEGLLDAITIEAGEGITLNFKECDLLKDIRWVVEETRLIFPNTIIENFHASQIIGVFDGMAIRRILENLITNAVKYGTSKERITIAVSDLGDQTRISVHNFGEPIPEHKQDEIFDYLKSNKRVKKEGIKSWGLGLSLVKTVTEAHGGTVKVLSNEELGTEFQITLLKNISKSGKIKTQLS